MDGFFGIGFGELVMIAIVALIVLGPERLPGALREVAKFIRMVRNLTREFTDQFGDEFKALEDLNPRRLLQEAINDIDDEERSKDESTKAPAKKNTTTAAKSTATPKATTPKPTTPKPATPKSTTPKATDTKAESDKRVTATGDSSAAGSGTDGKSTGDTAATPTGAPVDGVDDNQIAPPELVANSASSPFANNAASTAAPVAAEPTGQIVQTNGHGTPAVANHHGAEPHVAESAASVESSSTVTQVNKAVQGKPGADQSVVDESIVMSDPTQDEETQP